MATNWMRWCVQNNDKKRQQQPQQGSTRAFTTDADLLSLPLYYLRLLVPRSPVFSQNSNNLVPEPSRLRRNWTKMNNNKMGGVGGGGRTRQKTKAGVLQRQHSVYSLTLDELHCSLGGIGKDLGSMNMDELLKNIWTAEESKALTGSSAPSVSDAGIQNTVDQVWKDLAYPEQVPSATTGVSSQRGQPTMGESTLEEFLVRAEVVREEPSAPAAQLSHRQIGNSGNCSGNINNDLDNVLFGESTVANNVTGLEFPFVGRSSRDVLTNPVVNSAATNLAMLAATAEPSPFGMPHGAVDLRNSQGIRGGGIVGFGQVGMSNGLMTGAVGSRADASSVTIATPVNYLPLDSIRKSGGDQSSVSPVPYVFSGGLRGRKSSTREKVFERRQRRMIKNRESAARSRARKQAYTLELEDEVAKLKERNEELQNKQMEAMVMQKKQILEVINKTRRPKKQCLRRTQTGPW